MSSSSSSTSCGLTNPILDSNGSRRVSGRSTLHWTRSEVDNGGFRQYLHNPTGTLANDALRGADHVGAIEIASVLRELASLFPDATVPLDQCDRIAFLQGSSPDELARLDGLNQRFYELMRRDPGSEQSRLAGYCAAYVDAHPDEFFLLLPQLERSSEN